MGKNEVSPFEVTPFILYLTREGEINTGAKPVAEKEKPAKKEGE